MITLTTYTIQVLGPNAFDENGELAAGRTTVLDDQDKRVLANLPAYVETWQEDMSDLLPEGYEVKIVEAMT